MKAGINSTIQRALGKLWSLGIVGIILILFVPPAMSRAPGEIIEMLKDKRTRAQALSEMKSAGPESLPGLRRLAHDRNVDLDTRVAARLAMGRSGMKVAHADLEDNLATDTDPLERESSAIALGQLGEVKALPHLRKALKDSHGNVRMRAAWAMAKLGDKSGQAEAIDAFNRSDTAEKFLAIDVLEAIGDMSVIPRLKEHFRDATPFTGIIAKLAVHRLEFRSVQVSDQIEYLKRTLLEPEHEIQSWAAEELGQMFKRGSPEALDLLRNVSLDIHHIAQGTAWKELNILVAEGKLAQSDLPKGDGD